MKKIIITILILLVGLAGCGEKTQPISINYNEIDNIIILIDLLPTPVTEEDRNDFDDIINRYNILTKQEQELVTNYHILEDAINYFGAIDETVEKQNKVFDELAVYYDNYIDDYLYDNIEFPVKHNTELGEVKIIWGSSDNNTITSKGQVIRGRKNISVELTTTFILDDARSVFKQKVVVKSIVLDRLPTEKLAIGYVMSSGSFNGLSEKALETLDVVNYAFASIVNNKVVVNSLANLNEMLEARRHGVRVLLCVGGYGKNAVPFSKAASTAQGRYTFAKSLVDGVEKYHFDGIDIDWEYPGFYEDAPYFIKLTEDRINYNLLMAEIRKQLKTANEDYLLTAAVPGGTNYMSNYDLVGLNKILDYFNLMTYDFDAKSTSSHVASLYKSSYSAGSSIHQSVTLYLNNGVDANKLIVGIPFYGRRFALNDTGKILGASSAVGTSISYGAINSNFLSRTDNSVTLYRDEVARVPYLYDERNNVTICYEDPQSIKEKVEYTLEKNLAGVMFWEYSQDYNDALITAIYDNLKKR